MFGEKEKIAIYLGGDHAAFEAKGKLKIFLDADGYHTTDLGTFNEDSIDYPDIAREVGEKVVENKNSFGILHGLMLSVSTGIHHISLIHLYVFL